jgi:hypothetical protein
LGDTARYQVRGNDAGREGKEERVPPQRDVRAVLGAALALAALAVAAYRVSADGSLTAIDQAGGVPPSATRLAAR